MQVLAWVGRNDSPQNDPGLPGGYRFAPVTTDLTRNIPGSFSKLNLEVANMPEPRLRRFAPSPAFTIGVITLTVMFGVGCRSANDLKLAEQRTSEFHSQFDSEQYHVLYAEADENLHKATSEGDFIRFLQAVHQKLGKVQRSQRRNFQVNWSTGQGTVLTLVYDTAFDGGNGTEQFAWHVRNNQLTLLSYHINSNVLVMK